jgi:ATP-dependent Clp endopeptidase proteolytic subunit ClpP
MDFQYVVDAESSEPIMLINKHIGFDEVDGMGIDGSSFQAELLKLDSMGKKRIQVWINSPGGVVTDGYSIYNAILKSNTPVDTYDVGIAASIAGVIFQAGRRRVMSDYSILMYHNPFGGNDKSLAAIRESIVKMIAKRSGMSENEVAGMMARESYVDASEALIMGLCDSIEGSEDINTKYLRAKPENIQAFYGECNKILNSLNKKEDMSLNKIKAHLNLDESATEENVIEAIAAIENKVKAEADKNEDELAKLKQEMEEAKAAYEEMKAKYDEMQEDKAKAEDEAKAAKAKNLVEEAVKAGKIKGEEAIKNSWTSLAVADFDNAKTMLDSIAFNKEAAKIPVENTIDKNEVPTSAALLEAKTRNSLKNLGRII